MSSSKPKKKTPSLEKKRNAWYDGTHYQHTQPFATFLTCRGKIVKKSLVVLKKEINALIPTPPRATVLEIGPGLAPVLSFFPFREAYYLEQSPAIAQQLMKKSFTQKKSKTISHFIVGDIQKLPFSKHTRFDLVVMNEVLTHVPPGKRTQVLKKAVLHAHHLLLVERPQSTYPKFLDSLYPEMRKKYSQGELKTIYSAYTRFNPLIQMLRENGWTIRTHDVRAGETYRILTGVRK